MPLPPGFLDDLRNRTSIADLVGRRVTWDMRKSNKSKGDMWAPCPFHHEKTASFHVDDRKGYYHCFGCEASGDVITFLRESDNLGFMEAVELLARDAGLEMPARDPQAQRIRDRLGGLSEVMEMALSFYRLALKQAGGAEARAYLARRGLTQEALDRWEIGFAPAGWDALRSHMTGSGVSLDDLREAGLLKASTSGRAPYDVFRNRILYPIRDAQGRLAGFGGRAMDPNDNAKYLNSPDTPLFQKSRLLYNLRAARSAVGRSGTLIVAEGYMDVIALAEHGFPAAVAPLGTAVTEEQLQLMWRVCDEPVVMLDGDAAGLKAAHRVIDKALPLLEAGRGLRFAIVPDGKDPDDLLRERGRDAMRAVIDGALPMVDLLWRGETDGRHFDSPERRAALDKAFRTRIAGIRDPSIRHHYTQAIREKTFHFFRTAPTRRDGRRGRAPPGLPSASAKASHLAAGQADQSELREAVIFAALLSAPSIAAEFESDLLSLDCATDVHNALREAIVASIATEADPRAAIVARIGEAALEGFLSARHLQVLPCMRHPGDSALARQTVAEALTRISVERGWHAELREAEEDLTALSDVGGETLTWRLAQAAEARNRAGRSAEAEDTAFDLGPNGAAIDRTERDAFKALIGQIRFDKGRR